MGLDTSHNAFSGPYSMFMSWRIWLAEQIGIPLDLMEGFYSEGGSSNPFILLEYKFPKGDEIEMSAIRRIKKMFPLKWSAFRPSPLHKLLYHSDCDGHLNWKDCGKIADILKQLLTEIKNDNAESRSPETARGTYDGMYNATERFMKGCRLAFNKKQKLEFH
jgi:hypothetical protein